MNMIRSKWRTLGRMARAAMAWELAFLCSFPALLALVLAPRHGLPRMIGAFVTILMVFAAVGSLLVIDSIRNRAGNEPPAPLG